MKRRDKTEKKETFFQFFKMANRWIQYNDGDTLFNVLDIDSMISYLRNHPNSDLSDIVTTISGSGILEENGPDGAQSVFPDEELNDEYVDNASANALRILTNGRPDLKEDALRHIMYSPNPWSDRRLEVLLENGIPRDLNPLSLIRGNFDDPSIFRMLDIWERAGYVFTNADYNTLIETFSETVDHWNSMTAHMFMEMKRAYLRSAEGINLNVLNELIRRDGMRQSEWDLYLTEERLRLARETGLLRDLLNLAGR